MAIKLHDDDPAAEAGIFAEINITPLTDIFVVLLIIFMVSSSVVVEEATRSGLKVNLPKGAAAEVDPGAKSLVVSITAKNEFYVQGQKVAREDLKRLFDAAAGRESGTQVIVEADEGVPHGTVVTVMELAKASGLHKLAIATKSGK